MKKIIVYLLIIAAIVVFSGCEKKDDYTPREEAHLKISTFPIAGDIYIDGTWKSKGSWEGDVTAGLSYEISFGDVPSTNEPSIKNVCDWKMRWNDYTNMYDKKWACEDQSVTYRISYTKPAPIDVYLSDGDDREFKEEYVVNKECVSDSCYHLVNKFY